MANVTVAQIKTAIKTAADATSKFGSVYTDCRERIEKPSPAAVMMFHDSGSQETASYATFQRTPNLILYLFVPRLATNGDAEMQQQMDESLEDLLQVFIDDPTLGGLVEWCSVDSWDISVAQETAQNGAIVVRMIAEVRVSVRYSCEAS
jgi:hypothetical protein